jgi:hypothetical protein
MRTEPVRGAETDCASECNEIRFEMLTAQLLPTLAVDAPGSERYVPSTLSEGSTIWCSL